MLTSHAFYNTSFDYSLTDAVQHGNQSVVGIGIYLSTRSTDFVLMVDLAVCRHIELMQ
jgi:hypothetical protein